MPELSQPLLGFSEPAYFRGTTARTRRSGESGAIAALHQRTQKIATLRRLWTRPHTIQDIAAISGFAIGSVCSLKKCLKPELVEVDTVEKLWADGRITKRVRWQILAKAGR